MIDRATHSGGAAAYASKEERYFNQARRDYVDRLPDNPRARILEIGCGYGDTGAYALDQKKCEKYCGIELFPAAGERARDRLTEVLIGDVEKVEFPWTDESFDAVILSEVLEHLVDPWKVLHRLRPLLRPGALVFASSPNVAHYRVIWMLCRGRWELSDRGALDRTHLRWFTPQSFREAFEAAGFAVDSVAPVTPFSWKTRACRRVFGQRLDHLFMRQVSIIAHVPPLAGGKA